MAADQLIPVRIGNIEVEMLSTVRTKPTFGRRAAWRVVEAFGRAQDAIIEVTRSIAQRTKRVGAAVWPDRMGQPASFAGGGSSGSRKYRLPACRRALPRTAHVTLPANPLQQVYFL